MCCQPPCLLPSKHRTPVVRAYSQLIAKSQGLEPQKRGRLWSLGKGTSGGHRGFLGAVLKLGNMDHELRVRGATKSTGGTSWAQILASHQERYYEQNYNQIHAEWCPGGRGLSSQMSLRQSQETDGAESALSVYWCQKYRCGGAKPTGKYMEGFLFPFFNFF